MQRYRETAWEQTMKVQKVILRATAKRVTWWQAAEILGSERAALSREARGGARDQAGLHLGEASLARGGAVKRGRKRRPRRPLPGMLLHLDGGE